MLSSKLLKCFDIVTDKQVQMETAQTPKGNVEEMSSVGLIMEGFLEEETKMGLRKAHQL